MNKQERVRERKKLRDLLSTPPFDRSVVYPVEFLDRVIDNPDDDMKLTFHKRGKVTVIRAKFVQPDLEKNLNPT